jgi:hypothetical protein
MSGHAILPGAVKGHPLANMATTSFTPVGNSADSRGVAHCRATVCCTPPNHGHQARWAAERSAVTCMHGLGRMLAIITFVIIKNTLDDLIFRLLWVLSSIRFNQPFPNPSITNPYFEFFIVPLNLIRKRWLFGAGIWQRQSWISW